MSLALSQNVTAISPGLSTYVLGVGGTGPYTYAVLGGGAGGTVDASTGLYQAPAVMNPNPAMIADTIQVTDALAATATGTIEVGNALILFCDIIKNGLSLANGRVYLWDQKIFQPDDFDLYVAISVMRCKPFANSNRPDGSGAGINSNQSVNMMATLSIDILSRGPAARDRKEEVIMALNSDYSNSQQNTNSFHIGRLPPGAQFVNLSNVDGDAIPYRFNISVNMQYVVTKVQAVPYFDSFSNTDLTVNP